MKAGAGFGGMGVQLGFEVKYLTDKTDKDIVLTPKIGVGAFTLLIICYGYNFSTNNNPFPNIGRHQFSMVSNLPPLRYFKKKKMIILYTHTPGLQWDNEYISNRLVLYR